MSPRRRPKGDSRDGSFVRPISPAIMPELIREAETELEKSFSGSERFTTPMRANLPVASTSQSRHVDPSQLFDPIGPREWAKNDWKILDACFTDERLDAAEKMGMAEGSLADVTDIRLDDVVSRFVEIIGGDAALAGLGPSWMRLVFVNSHHFEYELIGSVTQERYPEAGSCFREEAKDGERRPWDTPSLSDAVFRVRAYGSSRLYAHRAPAGR